MVSTTDIRMDREAHGNHVHYFLVPATVNRYLHAALDVLLETLDQMPEAQIAWPSGPAFDTFSKIVQERHPILVGAFGVVDGLNLLLGFLLAYALLGGFVRVELLSLGHCGLNC